jgi:Glycosyl hydrolase family 26
MAKLKVPDAGKYYHGVYPGGTEQCPTPSLANLNSYVNAVGGKNVAFVTCYHEWSDGLDFPWPSVKWILANGAVPCLRLATRTVPKNFVAETVYTLEAIVAGKFDAILTAWGNQAKTTTLPLLCEWGTEVNGYWFPWNAAHNGADGGDDFGAPLFKQAYQHIVTTIRNAGAVNISWVFHVNFQDNPAESWNKLEAYDPGSKFTDWIGVSLYGSQSPDDEPSDWVDFVPAMDTVYNRVTQLEGQRPIMLSEFGFCANNGNPGEPAVWTQAALTAILSNRWPRLAGFSWWNESWDQGNGEVVEFHVQNIPGLPPVFATQLASQTVLYRPTIV